MTSQPGFPTGPRSVVTGLSGNELFCIDKLGYRAGDLLVGNSVYSLGLLGGIGSAFNAMAGGEVTQITEMITAGRHLSTQRLMNEMRQIGAHGATGMSSELIFHAGNVEFLSVASASTADGPDAAAPSPPPPTRKNLVPGGPGTTRSRSSWATSPTDRHRPHHGAFRQRHGRGAAFDIFTHTRSPRCADRGRGLSVGANAVVGIKTSILPFGGTGSQMLMVGTAPTTTCPDPTSPRWASNHDHRGGDLELAKIGYRSPCSCSARASTDGFRRRPTARSRTT